MESFTTGQTTPLMEARSDFQKYNSANRILENMLVYPQGPAFRRPGTRYITEQGPATFSELYGDYKMTYISDNAAIWGVPLDFITRTTLVLDTADVNNVGGGIVGLPCIGHPFASGDVIWIAGTTHYENSHTLTSGTTANELQFTDTYNAETFNGDETVVEYILLPSSLGRMTQDSSGNLYYGHTYISESCVVKIETDGTIVTDFFSPDGGWSIGKTISGIEVSSDNLYLYAYTDEKKLYKFNLSDGSEIWQVTTGTTRGYDIFLDADDNVYIPNSGTGSILTIWNMAKFTAADGTKTVFDLMGERKTSSATGNLPYAVCVDDDMGIVIVGGAQVIATIYYELDNSLIYNLAKRDLGNTEGVQITLGDTYTAGVQTFTRNIATNCVVTYNGFIYVLIPGNLTIYKLDSDLTVKEEVPAPDYAIGIFVDLAGNIVIVNQDRTSPYRNDIFWWYDADLNFLKTSTEDYYNLMFISWDSLVGGPYIEGNVAFYPGIREVSSEFFIEAGADTALRLIPCEHSTNLAYVLSLGDKYMGFYRTTE